MGPPPGANGEGDRPETQQRKCKPIYGREMQMDQWKSSKTLKEPKMIKKN